MEIYVFVQVVVVYAPSPTREPSVSHTPSAAAPSPLQFAPSPQSEQAPSPVGDNPTNSGSKNAAEATAEISIFTIVVSMSIVIAIAATFYCCKCRASFLRQSGRVGKLEAARVFAQWVRSISHGPRPAFIKGQRMSRVEAKVPKKNGTSAAGSENCVAAALAATLSQARFAANFNRRA